MLKPIELKSVTAFLKQYQTEGHRPFLVLTDDLKEYILKAPLNSQDKAAITREFICNQLLTLWQIETPPAAILTLANGLISSEEVKMNKSLRLFKTFFGSLYQPNSIDLQGLINASTSSNKKKIINIEDLLDIALFDIWVENDDRRPTNNNIILKPVGSALQILPIDNAFTFSSMLFESLQPEYVSFSDNDSILFSPLGCTAVKYAMSKQEWASKAREKFYLRIQKAEESFEQICDFLPPDYGLSALEAACLRSFLFSPKRNTQVFELFCYIVSTVKQ